MAKDKYERKIIRLEDLISIINTTGRKDSKGWILARLQDLGYIKKDSLEYQKIASSKNEKDIRKLVMEAVQIDKKDSSILLEANDESLQNILFGLGFEQKELKEMSREDLAQLAIAAIGDKSLLTPIKVTSIVSEKKVTKYADFMKENQYDWSVSIDEKIEQHRNRVKNRHLAEKKSLMSEASTYVSLDDAVKAHRERIASKQVIKTPKKIWSKDKITQIINADTAELRANAILAGCTQAEVKGKTDQQLRKMIFNHVTFDNDSMIKVLCSPSISQLKQVLVGMGASWDDVASKSRDELEKMYISRVGLDDIIEARDDVKKQELIYGSKLNHRYENSLIALRRERGKEIAKELKTIKTPEARETFLNGLSQAEREDVVSYQSVKNLAKDAARMQNEFIENALT